MNLVPLLLERKLVPKPWGGRALETLLGIDLGGEVSVGESWELYDRAEEGSSRVRGEPGLTVHELMQARPEEFLGHGVEPTPQGRFPLAVKLIDASERLSVQVHPGEEQGREAGDCGKSEAWVVLGAGARARVVRGLAPGVSVDSFAAVAAGPDVEEALSGFAPRVGDVIWVPPGVVHSIGPDVLAYEVQRNSGVTFRLWDWGRPRDTHVSEALRALRAGDDSPAVCAPRAVHRGVELLVEDPFFRLRRLRLEEPATLETGGRFQVITVIEGRIACGWRSGGQDAPLLVGRGDTVLVPACTEAVFLSPIGSTTMFVADPGEA